MALNGRRDGRRRVPIDFFGNDIYIPDLDSGIESDEEAPLEIMRPEDFFNERYHETDDDRGFYEHMRAFRRDFECQIFKDKEIGPFLVYPLDFIPKIGALDLPQPNPTSGAAIEEPRPFSLDSLLTYDFPFTSVDPNYRKIFSNEMKACTLRVWCRGKNKKGKEGPRSKKRLRNNEPIELPQVSRSPTEFAPEPFEKKSFETAETRPKNEAKPASRNNATGSEGSSSIQEVRFSETIVDINAELAKFLQPHLKGSGKYSQANYRNILDIETELSKDMRLHYPKYQLVPGKRPLYYWSLREDASESDAPNIDFELSNNKRSHNPKSGSDKCSQEHQPPTKLKRDTQTESSENMRSPKPACSKRLQTTWNPTEFLLDSDSPDTDTEQSNNMHSRKKEAPNKRSKIPWTPTELMRGVHNLGEEFERDLFQKLEIPPGMRPRQFWNTPEFQAMWKREKENNVKNEMQELVTSMSSCFLKVDPSKLAHVTKAEAPTDEGDLSKTGEEDDSDTELVKSKRSHNGGDPTADSDPADPPAKPDRFE